MAKSPHIIEVTTENFESAVLETSQNIPVLVDFWAAWCAPCKMLMPLLAKVADEYGGKFILALVDADAEQDLAAQYGVRNLPTVKLFKHGQVVTEFASVLPETQIRALLDAHIERESDKLAAQARILFENGDYAAALPLLRTAQNTDPGNYRLIETLIDVQMAMNDIDAAEQTLRALPANIQVDPGFTLRHAKLSFMRIAQNAPDSVTLRKLIASDPDNLDARYQLSAQLVIANDYTGSLEELMEILRRNKSYQDNAARKAMIKIFELLGGKGDLVNQYRPQMFNLLH